jgi:hypothetical protein
MNGGHTLTTKCRQYDFSMPQDSHILGVFHLTVVNYSIEGLYHTICVNFTVGFFFSGQAIYQIAEAHKEI